MPRKGENIYKRKDRRWEGRYPKNKQLARIFRRVEYSVQKAPPLWA